MHGLASHGVEGMGLVPGTVATSSPPTGPLMHPDLAPVGTDRKAVAAIDRSDSLQENDSGRGGMDMSIAMMCMAVLGAALLALLRFLGRERPRSVIWMRPYLVHVIVRLDLGPAPPSLKRLSIQRC